MSRDKRRYRADLAQQISEFRYSNKIPSETAAMHTLMWRGLALAAASQPQQETQP